MENTDFKAFHQVLITLYQELIKEQEALYGICPLSDQLFCDGRVEHCKSMASDVKCQGCLKSAEIYEKHIKELKEMM